MTGNSIKIRQGFDLQLDGGATSVVEPYATGRYYIRPSDFRWMTPQLLVREGDSLSVGTPLFADKRDPRVRICSPVDGTLTQVVRGDKRRILALVMDAKVTPPGSSVIEVPDNPSPQQIRDILLQYGLWPALRQRPYSVIADPDGTPDAIFVSCFDSAPLAPDFNVLLKGREAEWHEGIRVLRQICPDVPIHLGMLEDGDNALFEGTEGVDLHYFSGPHPAGNVGTQIDFIRPLDKGDVVWYIHPWQVAAFGRLILRHTLSYERCIALVGPAEPRPRYVTMTYGADLSPLLTPDPQGRAVRNISGNVLTGGTLGEFPSVGFYDSQLTRLFEGGEREFLGWLLPGLKKWSLSHTFVAWLAKRKKFSFNTSMQGGERALVMSDVYDEVFPMDFMPAELLKACIAKDVEQMEELGIYGVESEDFALCEVVCPSKIAWQQIVEEALHYLYEN
ncbi:MAG: NADH:ubiquinone reductase (Na(+)-transporting) subunit A [Bacteroidales bacterium]|nr:NADH:ubiquinone reductase (Na(+)-transporting) subunit A [Bacteroidales bacterium]